jgi:DNA-binding NtrC family response regulator
MPTLLVIDDEPAIRYAFADVFRAPEVRLLTAGSAREGLALMAQHRPDVLILDINLPDLPGLETFRRAQAIDAKTPVIFITAYGTTETAIEAMKLGAYDYLLKPLEHEQLCEVIARAFDISRLMRVPAVVGQTDPATDSADVLVG